MHRILFTLGVVIASVLLVPLSGARSAFATTASPISTDPFAASVGGQHASEVEPDTFAATGTVVSAFQVGRFYNGGATTVGFATDSGGTWTHGLLPGLTTAQDPTAPFSRATDPSVAYDAKHGVWLVSTLGLTGSNNVKGAAILVSRSSNGTSWNNPVTVASANGGQNYDKNWIVCDNTSTSPYYGYCYSEWDNSGHGDQILMNRSTDGGLTWSAPISPAGKPSGLGGQPLVQPNGTVIVPAANGYENAIISFTSDNGGQSWGNTNTVSTVNAYTEPGNLRSGPLPSAEIDASGKVYVVWEDCRFEAGCAANDLVMTTSTDGITWSPITRIPINTVDSGADYFLPGLAVNASTSGTSAQLALMYYYYPSASCTSTTCQLEVGFVSSTNGGTSWSTPTQLAGSAASLTGLGPMSLGWLPSTNQGVMVGDYFSTSFVRTSNTTWGAVPVFAVAQQPSNGVLNQAMYSSTLSAGGGTIQAAQTKDRTGTTHPFISADKAAVDKTVQTRKD